MRSYFVTATDTEIGKTAITAAIAFSLKNKSVNIGVMKPFACGTPQKHGFKSEDAQILADSAGVSEPEELVNPYFFPVAASPYTAARKLGKTIDIDLVLEKLQKLSMHHDAILVEGIGGILTPIKKDYYVADLIRDMGLDTIIITSSKIGTVNHTLLTYDTAEKYGIRIRGIIINNYDNKGYRPEELAVDLINLRGFDVLASVPHLENFSIPDISRILQNQNVIQKLMS